MKSRFVISALAVLALLTVQPEQSVRAQGTGVTTRVSLASNGAEGNSFSSTPAISGDGRYVAFESLATNLVSGDTNSKGDIFVHDRQTAQTTRVSVATGGAESNGQSKWPSISADGRYVAFQSEASNLVGNDTNGVEDIFVHDRQTGQTTRVSVASDGAQGNNPSRFPSVSADGRYVAFMSYADNLVNGDLNGKWDVFVCDLQLGQTTRVSIASDGTEGNQDSSLPNISSDGRYVAFASQATNLVTGGTNGQWHIFVRDWQTGQTTLVSVASDGTQGDGSSNQNPAISADGRYVAFFSLSTNLVSGDTNDLI